MAQSNYLDRDVGLPYFWEKIKSKFMDKPASASNGQVLMYNNGWIASYPVLPINPSSTPTTPGAIWIETN